MRVMTLARVGITCTGYSIVGDWYDTGADKSLLVIPGYMSKRVSQRELVESIALSRGYNALVIDLSGHGGSPFDIAETRPAQHLLEAVCVFDWLRNHSKRVSVMGTSYGGFLAAWTAHFRDFENLILRTPALYPPEQMYTLSGEIPRDELATGYRKDSEAVARHPIFTDLRVFDGPSLVVVHEKDEEVPAATTDAYIKSFKADRVVGVGMHHWSRDPANPANSMLKTYAAMGDWLQKHS